MNQKNQPWDSFLRQLVSASKNRRAKAMASAMSILAGSPPQDRILYSGVEAARMCSISYQTLWRLCKSGAIKPILIPGMGRPRYSRASLEKLAGGKVGGQ